MCESQTNLFEAALWPLAPATTPMEHALNRINSVVCRLHVARSSARAARHGTSGCPRRFREAPVAGLRQVYPLRLLPVDICFPSGHAYDSVISGCEALRES